MRSGSLARADHRINKKKKQDFLVHYKQTYFMGHMKVLLNELHLLSLPKEHMHAHRVTNAPSLEEAAEAEEEVEAVASRSHLPAALRENEVSARRGRVRHWFGHGFGPGSGDWRKSFDAGRWSRGPTCQFAWYRSLSFRRTRVDL